MHWTGILRWPKGLLADQAGGGGGVVRPSPGRILPRASGSTGRGMGGGRSRRPHFSRSGPGGGPLGKAVFVSRDTPAAARSLGLTTFIGASGPSSGWRGRGVWQAGL